MEQDKTKAPNGPRWLASGGAFSGLLALFGASCCVLPIVLVNLGVSTALVSNLAFFARAKPWFMGAAVIFVVIAFVMAFRGGRRPGAALLTLLVLSAALVAGAYVLPFYEAGILRWMNSP